MLYTKKVLTRLCVGLALLGSSYTQVQAAPAKAAPLSPQAKAALDKEFDAMIGNSGTKVPGLGVVVYKDGKKVYSKFAGRRKISSNPAWNQPVTPDTRFWGASISKEFTGYSIMQLVGQGKLKLDELISQRIPLEAINEGFDAMKAGTVARSVIVFPGVGGL